MDSTQIVYSRECCNYEGPHLEIDCAGPIYESEYRKPRAKGEKEGNLGRLCGRHLCEYWDNIAYNSECSVLFYHVSYFNKKHTRMLHRVVCSNHLDRIISETLKWNCNYAPMNIDPIKPVMAPLAPIFHPRELVHHKYPPRTNSN